MRLLLKHTVSSRISFFIAFFVYSLWVRKGEITPKSMQRSLILNCFSENTLLHPLSFSSKFAHSFRKSEHEKYVMCLRLMNLLKNSQKFFFTKICPCLFFYFLFLTSCSLKKSIQINHEKKVMTVRDTYRHINIPLQLSGTWCL